MTVADIAHVMDFIYNHQAPALRPEDVAEIFDQLVGCSDDNGAAIHRVVETWLTSENRTRVEVVLAMQILPSWDAARMAEVLGQVSAKWPELRERCETLMRERAVAERGGE